MRAVKGTSSSRRLARAAFWLGAAGAITVLVLLAYPSALGLPFTFDDPFDLPRAEHYPLWTILTSAPDYGYYRPVLYVLWQGLRSLLGGYDPFWNHFLTVAAHIANGCMVLLLGRQLAGRTAGLAAAFLFVLYPFSYQVVPWAGALFHPLMTLLVLAALLLYLQARRQGRPRLLAPALALAAVAMFTHEYGVMVAPLALLWPLLALPDAGRPRRLRYALPFFALAGVFLIVWWLAPKWQREPLGIHVDSLRLSGLYFAQGFIYPSARFGKAIASQVGWEPARLLLGLASATALGLGLCYWLGGRLRLILLAGLWYLLAVLPAWAVLGFDYIMDAPRLLYLASVGSALAWGGMLSLFPSQRLLRAVWRPVVAVVLALVAWQSWQFIATRNVLYDTGGALVREVMAVAEREEGGLFVNFPAWLAPKEDEYPIGHSGVVLVPDYIGLNAASYVNNGRSVPALSATFESILQQGPFAYGLHGKASSVEELDALARRGRAVYVTRFLPEGLKLEEAGRVAQGEPLPATRRADLADSFSLVEAAVERRGTQVFVSLRWFVRQANHADNTVFLHLYDHRGKLVAQNDGYPLQQLSPPRLWRAGDSWIDLRHLTLPADLPAGRYRVAAGMYDRQNGQRLPAHDVAGTRWRDDAVELGEVRLP